MKKFVSIVLSFCLVLTTLAAGFVTVFAEDNIFDSETSVTWSFNEETGVLSFEGEGAIPDYTYAEDDKGNIVPNYPWKDVAYTSIQFADTITGIGNYAFCYSSALESVVIPETITVLCEGAFYNCAKLKTATLPASVTVLPKSFFSACSALESVTFGSSTTEISDEAFYKCESLTSIELPAALEKIGEKAFSQCSDLTSITFPEGMKSIGERAFYACEKLEEVNFPSTLLTLGESVFASCKSLAEVLLPDGITDIPTGAFISCKALETVKLPANLYSVGSQAFKVCPELKSVEIPATIESIGAEAFGYGDRNQLVRNFKISGYTNTVARVYAESLDLDFESLGYRTKGACGEKIEWEYIAETNTLRVTGEGSTFSYAPTDFVPHNNIPYENIEISADITGFGDYVFFNAPAATFTLLEKVETIGEKAIGFCYDADGNIVAREGTLIKGYDSKAPAVYADENGIDFESIGKFMETEGKLGEDITWTYDKETKSLSVSGTGATYDFTAEELPYFFDYDIEMITVSEGITAIGNYAFCTDNPYGKIELNNQIVKIGEKAIGFVKTIETEETPDNGENNPADGENNEANTVSEENTPAVKVVFNKNSELVISGYVITPADEYADYHDFKFEPLEDDTDPYFSFVIPYSIDHMNSLIFIYAKNADVAGVMSAFPRDLFDEVNGPEKIATGQKITLRKGEETYEYTFVVKGDISGDGDVNSSDALLALQHSVGKVNIDDEPRANAADLNRDGNINSSDALAMLQISVGKTNPADMYNPGIIG